MIKKRIIPCLDVKDGRVVKGINFKGLRDIGDPVEMAARYNAAGADELVFLDVSATDEGHDLMLDVIKRTAEVLFIPLAIGGGIRTADDIGRLLKAGADKVSINSSALARPELIREAAERFGSQCVCLSVDAGWDEEAQDWFCFTHGGKKKTDIRVLDWVTEGEKLGAGEILLTSMEGDGTKDGFDLPLLKAVEKAVTVPVIASGGAGSADDFVELFRETDVSAGLAASIFHNEETTVGEVKSLLSDAGIPVRLTAGGVPNEPDFSKGLVPAVLQHWTDHTVLMLGYMDEEAYEKTLEDGVVWFYSRSKERLWKKGESSGHVQRVKSMALDCDEDTLLIRVEPAGPTCHTGTKSCFGEEPASPLLSLEAMIRDRQADPDEGSYTNYLLGRGLDKIAKKFGEESFEVVIAAMKRDREELKNETADLLYHLFVLLHEQGVSINEVEQVLHERHSKKNNFKGERQDVENW